MTGGHADEDVDTSGEADMVNPQLTPNTAENERNSGQPRSGASVGYDARTDRSRADQTKDESAALADAVSRGGTRKSRRA